MPSDVEVFEDQDNSWADIDQLQQRDVDVPTVNDHSPVNINVANLVRTRDIPARRLASNNLTVNKDGVPVNLIGRSNQRISLRISTSSAAGIYISPDPAVLGSYMTANNTRLYNYNGPIWVTCATTEAAAALVSYDALFTDD